MKRIDIIQFETIMNIDEQLEPDDKFLYGVEIFENLFKERLQHEIAHYLYEE